MKSAKHLHDDHFDLATGERSRPIPLVEDLRADLLPPTAHSSERTHLVNNSINKITAGPSAGLFASKVSVGTALQLPFPNSLGALSLCGLRTTL